MASFVSSSRFAVPDGLPGVMLGSLASYRVEHTQSQCAKEAPGDDTFAVPAVFRKPTR
jgi:hypothetical protein